MSAIQGVSFDTVADWTFDDIGTARPGQQSDSRHLQQHGDRRVHWFWHAHQPFDSSTFTPNNSTNDADITANGAPYSSTGAAGQDVWRLRGQPGNGWLSTQPIGSQGAEFDVSTVNYSNIIVTFDLYFTTQGEARMCVLYTTDGLGYHQCGQPGLQFPSHAHPDQHARLCLRVARLHAPTL